MEDTSNNLFFIVYDEERIIGYLQLNYHFVKKYESIPDERTIEILRFYIAPEYFGSGLAQEMMQVVFNEQEQFDGIYLGVWENNLRAQRFVNNSCSFLNILLAFIGNVDLKELESINF